MTSENYKIKVQGCDDKTVFSMLLDDNEADCLKRVAQKSKEVSNYRCMPIIDVEVDGDTPSNSP